MLGVVGRVEREHVSAFRKLAHRGKIRPTKEKDDYRHHVDGWGVGFFRDGGPRIFKEGTDCYYSYGYELVTREMLTYAPEVAIFHVRRASDKNPETATAARRGAAWQWRSVDHNGSGRER